jgi:predicted Kef-type K+ transport protein
MSRDTAITIYLVEAAVAGAFLAWPFNLDSTVLLVVALAFGVVGTVFRIRVLHERQWSRNELLWVAIFFGVFAIVRLTISGRII